MKLACLSFTDKGKVIGEKLTKVQDYQISHFHNKDLEKGIKAHMKELWSNYEGIIFISATAIALRFIASYINHKTIDPAIVVIDDEAKFSISLLSGHLGGANKIAGDMATYLNSIPVITTASDNRGFQSLDLFAKENNYYIEDMKSITRIASLMVNGKKIGFYSEDNSYLDYPNLIELKDLKQSHKDIQGLIIISSKNIGHMRDMDYALLRPKNINIAIGCRRGVEGSRIIAAIDQLLKKLDLSDKSIKSIGTIEVKKNEEGIIEASQYYSCPLKIFTIDEIKEVEDKFEKSQFVKDSIGVYSVSEPAAYLLGGDFLVKKSRHNGITISITKEGYNG